MEAIGKQMAAVAGSPTLRNLPAVEQLLQTAEALEMLRQFGRPLTLQALRAVLDSARSDFSSSGLLPEQAEILRQAGQHLLDWTAPSLLPVINASGVVLHTNLGRAPLSQAAARAVQAIASGYTNLEYDLAAGKRGSRLIHAEALLQRLTGAEAALVVNNNAAAVLLALMALARRRAVIISRTQLVEIGGGFRVPDVMKQSGARLIEIGATNRVHRRDYEAALAEYPAALVMRAHRSNFRLVGFTAEPELAEVAEVAHAAGVPLLDDLGSGALLDTARYGLGHEPTVSESLQAGADLVCFSGDKLLGGPQAGIIIGQAKLIEKLRQHPLARAVRADKLCLAALSATLTHYLKDEAESAIPVWRMLAALPAELQARAASWQQALGQGEVLPSASTVGGGSLPEETQPSYALSLRPRSPARFVARLRQLQPPIIARLEAGQVWLDPRTVLPEQESELIAGLRQALAQS